MQRRFPHAIHLRASSITCPAETLQVFSAKVAEIRGGLQWPLDVFGFFAVRDWIDHNRNIIYNRARDNCQTLTQEVCIVHWFVSLRLCFLTQLAIMTFFYLTHTCTSQPSLIFVTMEAYIHFLVAFTPIP